MTLVVNMQIYSGLQADDSSKITWKRAMHARQTSVPSELCFLKVHLRPTRFLQLYSASCCWHNAVKHCCDNFVVVDKPTGVPVQVKIATSVVNALAHTSCHTDSAYCHLHVFAM